MTQIEGRSFDGVSEEIQPASGPVCPICVSPAVEELADAEAIRQEMEELWAYHTRRVLPDTPPGHLTDRTIFSQSPARGIARCTACGTLFRSPAESAEEIEALYASEDPDPEVLRGLFHTQRDDYLAQARRIVEVLGPRGSGLEVGSYVGAFLGAAREVGWDFEGVDINEPASSFARGMGFKVHVGTIEEVVPEKSYDAIAFWNCFDQLPDPRRAAVSARDLLVPGGLLAIRVPNGACYASWRKRKHGLLAPAARAMLAQNNLLGFPYRHGFTPLSLVYLLRGTGFEPITVVGDTLVPLADRWTREWAAWEERLIKAAIRGLGDWVDPPWIEIYAKAVRPS